MTTPSLRDELDINRRRFLNELDDLMEIHLHRRVAGWRRDELVDEIEQLLQASDTELLRRLQGRAP
jgi:succinate dehydrogenase flavin-adding protein (antitoxin of CptAB toxin-antitoxin module)